MTTLKMIFIIYAVWTMLTLLPVPLCPDFLIWGTVNMTVLSILVENYAALI